MDLHKLRIFATVARLGSFTRAAETLHMTQPTISQQIAVLEQQLGTILIERQTRRIRLTAAGEALRPYADQMLQMADNAVETARAAAGIADRTLRLGVGHVLSIYLLPELLRRFREDHAQYRVRLSFGNTAELLEQIHIDAVDLALIGLPVGRNGMSAVPFMEDHLMVIVAPTHPWASRRTITRDELMSEVLLTREVGSALYASVERLLGTAWLQSEQVIQFSETEAIKRCVESGLGVALIQGIAVQRELEAGTLSSLRLVNVDDRRTYAYAFAENKHLSSAATALVHLLAQESLLRQRPRSTVLER